MGSRRTGMSGAFDDLAPQDPMLASDEVVYGKLAVVDAGRMIAEAISIDAIYPDETQPRRVLPSEIRAWWSGEPRSVGQLLQKWRLSIQDDHGLFLDLEQMVFGDAEIVIYDEHADHPFIEPLIEIASLARNIAADGLTNPITVNRFENRYKIETGERRWLSYHLLRALRGDQYDKIAARVVERNVWRQASENTQRQDLNAIGRARQLALLLMDLYKDEAQFQSYADLVAKGDCDRVFYAQVADGNQFRVPRGMGERLVNAMGLKHVDQLRQYRDLLRLPDEFWVDGDEGNWSEFSLRQFLHPPKKQDTVTTVTVSPENAPAETPFNGVSGYETEDGFQPPLSMPAPENEWSEPLSPTLPPPAGEGSIASPREQKKDDTLDYNQAIFRKNAVDGPMLRFLETRFVDHMTMLDNDLKMETRVLLEKTAVRAVELWLQTIGWFPCEDNDRLARLRQLVKDMDQWLE